MASKSEVESPDFSHPWKLSDLVLVVEEERFHVHRAMLAFWSPVFEKMFTSEFQEKDTNEVSLPGKKASEIKEMLLLMYPSLTEKEITEENCYFLFKLAHEYQMAAIVTRCEDFMAEKVKEKAKENILVDLVFAQTYKLEKLNLASVNQAHCLSLDELKQDEMFDQIQEDNLIGILEGIMKRLQTELDESRNLAGERQKTVDKMEGNFERVKWRCLDEVKQIGSCLVTHASSKHSGSDSRSRRSSSRTFSDINSCIAALEMDRGGHYCKCDKCCGKRICGGLRDVTRYLTEIKDDIEELLPPET